MGRRSPAQSGHEQRHEGVFDPRGGLGHLLPASAAASAAFFIYSVVPKVSQNPAEINAARDELAQITLPAGFEPGNMAKMDNMMFSMIVVDYRNPAVNGEISMAEFRLKVGNAKQQDEQMHQQLERQGFGNPKHLTNTKSETKTVEIKGKECNFNFRQGTDPGTHKKMREISGVVSRETGTGLHHDPDGRVRVQRRRDCQNAGGD